MPPNFPPAGPARSSRGPPSSLASYHSEDRPMRRTAIYGGHIARGADRSALRRLDARGLGFPRCLEEFRQDRPQSPPSTDRSRGFHARNFPALQVRALGSNSISGGVTATPPTPRALRRL